MYSLDPPWDCYWKGIGRKPYDARALTVLTVWQEIEGKPERAYTADLERDKERLHLLGLKHAPHRAALYRTRKRLSEEYMEKLNRRILERIKHARKLGADATGMRMSKRDCAWSSSSLNGRREYTKIHGLFNLEAGTVEAFKATGGTEHECKHLPDLLKRLDDMECFEADPAYLSRRNCMLVAEKGATPYIKPKKNSLMKAITFCLCWRIFWFLFPRCLCCRVFASYFAIGYGF